MTFENRYLDIDGGVHWMDWNADPESGFVYGIARDVTEQRAARSALEVDRLLARGARASMTKPFDVRAFLAIVDQHLGGRRVSR